MIAFLRSMRGAQYNLIWGLTLYVCKFSVFNGLNLAVTLVVV
jgi:hypothetical protein